MKPKFPTARDVVIHIGDDYWWLAALAMLYAGSGTLILGLFTGLGWASVPNLPAVIISGLVGIFIGAWVLYRRIGVVIDSSESTITIRRPLAERRVWFRDLAHIAIKPSRLPFAFDGPAPFTGERYDVVICALDNEVAVYHGLELSTARRKARVIADAIGRPVLHKVV